MLKTVSCIRPLDFVFARSWSYDKTDEARLLVEHSNMLSLGWNVITRAAPSWWHVNLGTTYLNVPLATVHHLYNVDCSVWSAAEVMQRLWVIHWKHSAMLCPMNCLKMVCLHFYISCPSWNYNLWIFLVHYIDFIDVSCVLIKIPDSANYLLCALVLTIVFCLTCKCCESLSEFR